MQRVSPLHDKELPSKTPLLNKDNKNVQKGKNRSKQVVEGYFFTFEANHPEIVNFYQ